MPALYDTGMPQKKHMIDDMFDRLDAGENPDDISASMAQNEAPQQPDMPQQSAPDVNQMAQDKLVADNDIQGKIGALEDNIVGRQNGLEKGLLGAASTLSAVNAQINNRKDVTKEGYDRAIQTLDEPNKQALTTREFLKERLARTDNPLKTTADAAGVRSKLAGASGAERGERMGAALEQPKLAAEQSGLKYNTMKTDAGIKAIENEPEQNSIRSTLDRKTLEQLASKHGLTGQSAKTLLNDYDSGLGKLDPKERAEMIDGLRKGGKVTMTNTSIGDNSGYVLHDENGNVIKTVLGKKTTGVDIAGVKNAGKGAAKPNTLSDKQVEGINTIDNALSEVDNIIKEKANVDTGPLAGRLNSVAQKVGIDDPSVSKFRARVGEQLAQYIRAISGAAVSAKERVELEANIPNMNDSDETFVAKLGTLQERLKTHRETALSNYGNQGKIVEPFNKPTESATNPSNTLIKTKKDGTKVEVEDLGGGKYRIIREVK
jgi:hypothetical protein